MRYAATRSSASSRCTRTGSAAPRLEWPLRLVAEQGARAGCKLFLLGQARSPSCWSWRERGDGLMPFYIRRIFRIGPMFLARDRVSSRPMEASGLSVGDWWSPLRRSPGLTSWRRPRSTHGFSSREHHEHRARRLEHRRNEMTFYLLLPLLVRDAALVGDDRVWAFRCGHMSFDARGRAGSLRLAFPGTSIARPRRTIRLRFVSQSIPGLPGRPSWVVSFAWRVPGLGAAPTDCAPRLELRWRAIIAIPFAADGTARRPGSHDLFDAHSLYVAVRARPHGVSPRAVGGFMVNRATRYIGKGPAYSAYFWHFPVLGLIDHTPTFLVWPAGTGLAANFWQSSRPAVHADRRRFVRDLFGLVEGTDGFDSGDELADRTVEKKHLGRLSACLEIRLVPPAVSARPQS